jgi:two-component system, OmpR family, phosphate regulon sensor histidine kinase PhoR
LGLAIVKHIVNRHRGELQIESRLGKGSEFVVLLPRA